MADKCAVFVLNGDVWERRSALKEAADELFLFMRNDLHGVEDKELLRGPEDIIGKKSLPQQILRELLQRNMVNLVREAAVLRKKRRKAPYLGQY